MTSLQIRSLRKVYLLSAIIIIVIINQLMKMPLVDRPGVIGREEWLGWLGRQGRVLDVLVGFFYLRILQSNLPSPRCLESASVVLLLFGLLLVVSELLLRNYLLYSVLHLWIYNLYMFYFIIYSLD